WIAAVVTAASLALLVTLAPAVFAGQTLLAGTPWIPSIGLDANFRLDGLALMFAGLITAIGLLIVLYAAYYLHDDDPAGKFFSQLMLFMAAMLGIALSDNLLLLVVFWELTSVSSFLLVGYWNRRADARAGARMALTVTGGGGLALLAGVIVLGQIAGTHDLSVMFGRAAQVQADPRYPLALGLILIGCFTKSAQLPFHFWLPEAMAAPTPVSAYLHSATMVKAGIFLLARLYPVLGGTALFEGVVAPVGLATMVFAAYVAVFKHDLKGLLAYSTISHLGLITFLIGLSTPLSAVAAVFHILNHATFKASLFMTAGIIDHETGTRDMRRLGGLYRFMPWTATLAMVAAASMAGVPLANGFLSKEMFFNEAVASQGHFAWGVLVPLAATLGGICSVAYSLRFIHDVFFNGPPRDMPQPQPHEPALFMKAPVALLVFLCVAVGILPALTFGPLVHVATAAVLGAPPPAYDLAIWHGLNLPLLMSAAALGLGVAMYLLLQRRLNLHLHHPRGWTGRLIFTKANDHLFEFAGRLTDRVENGSLQRYAALMVGAAVVAAAWPFL
ncbi:MAG TPA: proton-conducting transporter membrane subunit, partial [Burkholderiaceae bacterium]